MEVMRREFWKKGKLEFGYELGIANKLYYVKFWYPAFLITGKSYGDKLKLYKKLSTAESKISKFKESW